VNTGFKGRRYRHSAVHPRQLDADKSNSKLKAGDSGVLDKSVALQIP